MRGAKRRPDSNCGLIREFLLNNEDEELTNEDMQVKFGLTFEQVNGALAELKRQGVIESRLVRCAYYRGVK